MSEEAINLQPAPPRWFLVLREIVNERYITLLIYASIGFFTALGEVFESEPAKTLLGPMTVFVGGSVCYVAGAVLLALKMVMSGSWQDGKETKP